jgi:hypothetical protein
MTLNSVIKRIRELCLAHRQIRTFKVGRVTDFENDKTTKYPAVFVHDNGGVISTEGHAAMLNYRIFFLDLVNASEDTKENEPDVQSDMVSAAMDIIAQMNFGIFSDWRLSSENNLQLISEDGNDLRAGCYVDCSLRFKFTQNVCEAPSTMVLQAGPLGSQPSWVALELDSGTYTPTLYNTANVSSSQALRCQWLRVGDVVHVSGKVFIDPAFANSPVQLGISLPIASTFTSDGDLAGTAVFYDPESFILGLCGNIIANYPTGRANLNYFDPSSYGKDFWFTFTYYLTPL